MSGLASRQGHRPVTAPVIVIELALPARQPGSGPVALTLGMSNGSHSAPDIAGIVVISSSRPRELQDRSTAEPSQSARA